MGPAGREQRGRIFKIPLDFVADLSKIAFDWVDVTYVRTSR